ncbi:MULTISPECIES: helix-turn-helix domain-containing protein [Achromobacter]|uniref:helix-turn-helix domain-containing protein n=1 Tax=Achromobacter TaxID=222 RepID=UPI0006AC16CE|nr:MULTISPECIES: helix-turn-helix domain-containing protein [Achromobacter]KOQ29477.1 IclR family transcriptional regulator [Achromobacter xylosoxidans]KOQ29754.1 IclR family transcriptional regulator [Achromobacter xylosoxidans]KOQ34579.1 IclR family transcriptional regulator [Achromobacter xylosoxidans]KOQ45544.1 IclR family transcriptional regulator [Achromobacter xylosoxidans]KOQ50496.1 IclR family transcriptional regulator [Achromobacter xylosoxidans]
MNEAPINSAQRVLRIWKALRGHTLTGLSNQEIAAMTGESPTNVTRALATLMTEDLVTKYENGRYAHGMATLQFAQAHADHCARMSARITEINQRIAAGTQL